MDNVTRYAEGCINEELRQYKEKCKRMKEQIDFMKSIMGAIILDEKGNKNDGY